MLIEEAVEESFDQVVAIGSRPAEREGQFETYGKSMSVIVGGGVIDRGV